MKRYIPILMLSSLLAFSSCAKKADPKRSIEKIRQEVTTMSVIDLEENAKIYAMAIQKQRLSIQRIQEKIKKMPMEKVFSNNFLQNDIKKIGRKAEALFDRYLIYAEALKEKGGDLSKIQLQVNQ